MSDVIKALHTVTDAEVARNVVHYVYISTDSVYMAAKIAMAGGVIKCPPPSARAQKYIQS